MTHPYKRAMQHIEAPVSLIQETAEKMHAAHPPRRSVFIRPLTAGLVLALTAFFVVMALPKADFIVTDLTPGEFVSEVELADGHLRFEESASLPLPGLSFGTWGDDTQRWDVARYISWLGADPRPDSLPDGFAAAREEAAVTFLGEPEAANIQADELYLCYLREADGASLEVYVSKGHLPPHALAGVENNSTLRGIPLFVSYRPADGLWRGQFQSEAAGFAVLGNGVTQEEFIRFLHSLV